MTSTPSSASRKHQARSHLWQERLAQVIQAHQEAVVSHLEVQNTHEAILSLLLGVAAGEISPAHCVRLLRTQALRFADAPAVARLYRQTASDLERR